MGCAFQNDGTAMVTWIAAMELMKPTAQPALPLPDVIQESFYVPTEWNVSTFHGAAMAIWIALTAQTKKAVSKNI